MSGVPKEVGSILYDLEESQAAKANGNIKKKDRPRTTEIGVTFSDGYADGWVFGVPEVFREAMDIRFGLFVDRNATKTIRLLKGMRDEHNKLRTVRKRDWRVGTPPARSFSQGDVFYRPTGIRHLVWSEASKLMSHSIQVLDAQPDRLEDGLGGWVEFELIKYESGAVSERSRYKSLQGEFEAVLRTGSISHIQPNIGQ